MVHDCNNLSTAHIPNSTWWAWINLKLNSAENRIWTKDPLCYKTANYLFEVTVA